MLGLMLTIVVGTSIWVAYDSNANKVSIDNKPYSLNNGALAWFISCLILWIAMFPYYLVKRSKTLQQKQSGNGKMATRMSSDVPEEIKKYKQLLDEGVITHEEFEAKKKKLMEL